MGKVAWVEFVFLGVDTLLNVGGDKEVRDMFYAQMPLYNQFNEQDRRVLNKEETEGLWQWCKENAANKDKPKKRGQSRVFYFWKGRG